mmetsp:Transcript_213/g.557  ORF Transcript_213/g.557 Transcript_213/m.557 type:complete len:223 (-) Transcript_213:2590-3258(-)
MDGHQARWGALGAWSRRDSPDPGPERSAGPRHLGDRRAAPHRSRRGYRSIVGSRALRLCHGSPHRLGLHHDAKVPPQHLPRGNCNPGPRVAEKVRGRAGTRNQLPDARGRRGQDPPGQAGLPDYGLPYRSLRGASRGPIAGAQHVGLPSHLDAGSPSAGRWQDRGRREPEDVQPGTLPRSAAIAGPTPGHGVRAHLPLRRLPQTRVPRHPKHRQDHWHSALP